MDNLLTGCVIMNDKIKYDLSGIKYGRLLVLEYAGKTAGHISLWKCQCDCGKMVIIRSSLLKNGHTKSCGCIKKENIAKRMTKHGYCGSRVNNIWRAIKERCGNSNADNYKYYGGRGIKYDIRWEEFINFLNDMGMPPSNHHTIDRIDNNANYCKDNCKWALQSEQNINKRNTIIVNFNGENIPLKKIVDANNLSYRKVWERLFKLNWSIEDAIKII